MSKHKLLVEFNRQLICFFDELIEQFPENSDLVIARIFLKDTIPIEKTINIFIQKLLPLKQFIVDRNETFFLTTNDLFRSLDQNKVSAFQTIWQSPSLDEEDKKIIWQWFDKLMYLVEKYDQP